MMYIIVHIYIYIYIYICKGGTLHFEISNLMILCSVAMHG